MVRRMLLSLLSCGWLVASCFAEVRAASPDGLLAWWRFDEVETKKTQTRELEHDDPDNRESYIIVARSVRDDAASTNDKLSGYHRLVRGVSGNALRFGGINTYVARSNDAAPRLNRPFTIEAWIAIGAYPVHWCPIVAQADEDRGMFFGIDAYGHLGSMLAIDGEWLEVVSSERIGMREWAHVACSYSPGERLEIYVNGKKVAARDAHGSFVPTTHQELLIGRSSVKRKPLGTIRQHGTMAVHTFFDGLIDELKIHDRALSAEEVNAIYAELQPTEPPELPDRPLPAGPPGKGPFGAFYTTLKYYDAWDAQWRVGEHGDVVVRFEESPCRFVFWRGTSYIPNWVTENGIWYNNQFNETWSEHGCHEPMSDKQCRHAHVRIIESSDARVVVHWRYALVDNWYEFARVDPATGWGDWTDEVFTIYPDGVAVRKVTLRSTNPDAPHEWHEGIIVMGPGQRPETVLQPEALTLLNISGEANTLSWRDGAPQQPTTPPHASIQIVNTKSEYRPFIAVPSKSKPTFDIYDGELRRDVSMFPWWNHWPTAFDPCDGRYAMDADRASHSSLTHCYWNAHEQTENSMTKIMLNGLTHKSAEDVVRLTKSWDSPPALTIENGKFADAAYDPAQRAYVTKRAAGGAGSLKAQIKASDKSPLVNIALVIEGWGDDNANVTIDEQPTKFRANHRAELDRSDLIVWIEHETTKPLTLAIEPKR
jgi:concanavalin A-like lectin/glucanase superfamily protein